MLQSVQNDDRTTALVLSGGGAKGAYQAGVLEVLHDAGFRFNAISGVSVGALNGAMLATGQLQELLDVWCNMTPDQILRKHSLLALAQQYFSYKLGLAEPPVSRYHNGPLQHLMKEHLLGKAVHMPFHFGYVKLESGVYVKAIIRRSGEHTIDQRDLDRLLASTAIPVFFNPTIIGDDTCVDGGLRNISPIKEVLPHQPDRLIVIPTKPTGMDPEETGIRDIIEIALRSIAVMLDEIFDNDIDRFLSVNRLVQQAEAEGCTLTKADGTPYHYIEPIIIDPREPLGDTFDFENDKVRKMMEKGRKRALEVLEEIGSA